MNKKKITIIVILVSIILTVIAITTSTYALFYNEKVAPNKNEYSTGLLSIEASSKTETISLNNAIPMEDSEGVETKPYIFTISNKGNLDYTFNVRLLSTSSNTINPNYIKLKIDDGEVTTLSSLTNSTIKSNLTLKAKESIDIEIRVWLAINTPNTEIGKSFTSNLVIDGQAVYTEPSRDDEIYTVTFDADGGTTPVASKSVTVGSRYGTLPTPTRTGYTFKGWNGKNLLNLYSYIDDRDFVKVTENNITIYKTNEQVAYIGDIIELNNNMVYTLSANIEGKFNGRIYGLFGDNIYYHYAVTQNKLVKTFTAIMNDDKNRLRVYQNFTDGNAALNIDLETDEVIISNIQIEEGDTATTYEPYYITSDTTVVQEKNHTLKAIWEPTS